jgi:hypothetical protein
MTTETQTPMPLTVTPDGAPWEPKTLEKLQDYPEAKFNLLVPTVSLRQINPYLVPDIEVVQLSPDHENGGDIYHDAQMKTGYYAPTAKGLAKLATVAGVTMLDSRRMDDGKDPDIVEWRVEVEMTTPTGRTRQAFGTKQIDLHTLAKGWTPARLAKQREHLVAMAETKAFNRAIRSLLSLHGAYPLSQLAKPFAVLRYVPDMSHPDVRRMFLSQLAPASAALFGPANGDQKQLASAEVERAPEAPEEDVAPARADVTPDGEKVEDPDWSVPAAAVSAGEQFVTYLRERAEASKATGPATQQQRDQLKATLRGYGEPNVMAVLAAAWDLKSPGEVTSAQAEAILDHAEGKLDFQAQWMTAAEWTVQVATDA